MEDTPGGEMPVLIDLGELDLADLDIAANPVLTSTLQKISDELEVAGEAIAGWNSSL